MAGDLLEGDAVALAMEDVHTAYYLVHSMGGGPDFAGAERQAAERFATAAPMPRDAPVINAILPFRRGVAMFRPVRRVG